MHQLSVQKGQRGKSGRSGGLLVLAEEVMLVGKAVTREVAPRKAKAKAVAVNFILFGSCYPPSGRGGSFWWIFLVEKYEEGSQEECEETAIYELILSDA
jgi:hypothetical protein